MWQRLNEAPSRGGQILMFTPFMRTAEQGAWPGTLRHPAKSNCFGIVNVSDFPSSATTASDEMLTLSGSLVKIT